MGRKLKGKIGSKGLKGALLRHKANEEKAHKVKKRSDHEAKKGKPTKQPARQRELQVLRGSGFVPFTEDSRILLIGEGDFSYAKSIVEQEYVKPENLIVTSYDSGITELKLKYPHSFEENYEFLSKHNVVMLFGIDAKNLRKSLKISKKTPWHRIVGPQWSAKTLDTIIFNFPHTGRGIKDQERNISEHQQLVFEYFNNCKDLFELVNNSKNLRDSSRCLSGYSTNEKPSVNEEGFGKIVLTLFEGEPYDSWQIKILAKENGWKLERSGKFDWSKYPGYHHKRTNSEMDTTKPAEEREARIYVFERFDRRKHSKTPVKDDSDEE